MADVILHGAVFEPVADDTLRAETIRLADGVHPPIEILTDENRDAAIALADALIPRLDAANDTARDAVVDEFHTLWNDSWRQGAPELNAAAFRAKLDVESVRVHAEYFEIWFADRTLFAGHALLAVFMPMNGAEIARGNFGVCSPEMFG